MKQVYLTLRSHIVYALFAYYFGCTDAGRSPISVRGIIVIECLNTTGSKTDYVQQVVVEDLAVRTLNDSGRVIASRTPGQPVGIAQCRIEIRFAPSRIILAQLRRHAIDSPENRLVNSP